MTSTQKYSSDNAKNNSLDIDEIDLNKAFGTLVRNKFLISTFAVLGLIFGCFYAFSSKKVWQGEFQIVLEDKKAEANPLMLIDLGIANLAGSSSSTGLTTEVEILKSPYILFETFEFVKREKALRDTPIDNLRFKTWRDSSLDIRLEKGTEILNLSYKDTDKDLILEVLNRISDQYQKYSGKKRLRTLALGRDYFKKQIKEYKIKQYSSLSRLQKFALKHDLSMRTPYVRDVEIENEMKGGLTDIISSNIEDLRVNSKHTIRLVDQKKKQFKALKEPNEIINFAQNIYEFQKEKTLLRLKDIDYRLVALRVIYKEADKQIKDLLREKELLVEMLKGQVIGVLEAKKATAEARIAASNRPEEVLIKYRQLLNESHKDNLTLAKLEAQSRTLELEIARTEDPWKLITEPSLLPFAVAPKRLQILMFSLLGGIFTGSVAAFISEIRKDLIYSIGEIEPLIGLPLLGELSINNKQTLEESLALLASGPLSNNEESIALLTVGKISKSALNEIDQGLKALLKNRQFIVTKVLRESLKCHNIVLVSSLGLTRRKDLIQTKTKLLLQNKQILGLLVLTDDNS